jgi:hypothetical protein
VEEATIVHARDLRNGKFQSYVTLYSDMKLKNSTACDCGADRKNVRVLTVNNTFCFATINKVFYYEAHLMMA